MLLSATYRNIGISNEHFEKAQVFVHSERPIELSTSYLYGSEITCHDILCHMDCGKYIGLVIDEIVALGTEYGNFVNFSLIVVVLDVIETPLEKVMVPDWYPYKPIHDHITDDLSKRFFDYLQETHYLDLSFEMCKFLMGYYRVGQERHKSIFIDRHHMTSIYDEVIRELKEKALIGEDGHETINGYHILIDTTLVKCSITIL